ncbi:hypothetical protein K5E40_18920 [Pseudomonas baetica]|jgi:hypothetical protein|uniref:Uncharacterized protein n=1 Tax=Pseudomonas fluorescens (strain SBW25) TaxID=216595 RepID=A4V7A8_PSEFS|nr:MULTISPECIES: hypothetical protein [Pseudomonas]MBF6042917.1 hypothetical protein [Pseudomonas mucoides]MBX9407752.1 hypothetical protein [Pseudomonas baetica]NMX82621.1 AsnC family protein [Pseudomonas sp. WS 5503]NNB23808.1 AsnC family protein [Pseudomonas fragi]WHT75797.1 hypothetical protein QMY54_00532 [Pseudomonas rhodesiae]
MNNMNFRGDLVWFIALANDLVTPWEAGRQAANLKEGFTSNPFETNTFNHAEWAKGFAHGVSHDAPAVSQSINASVVVSLPLMEVQHLPDRAFWAEANRLSVGGMSEFALAARLGVSRDQLSAGMILHHFWDEDAIPLGIREAG